MIVIVFGLPDIPGVSAVGHLNADEVPVPTGELSHFENEVVPILAANCLKCHSGNVPKGGLNLTTREAILSGGDSGPAVEIANAADSLLIKAVHYDGFEMPPTGQLSQRQISALVRWVDQGLHWYTDDSPIHFEAPREAPSVNDETKRHWSFQPVRKPPVPSVSPTVPGWVRNEIDAFILRQLEENELTPNPVAEPRELVRRACYDLTGLPPSPEMVTAFEANPTSEAWAALIDTLLESPHYGEKWGRHWLDLVRYAETNSYERDGAKPFAWRYRDYVIKSLNADKPYDVFLTEQLAGDELPNRTADQIIATGFYRLGRWDDEPADPELAYYDDIDDIVTTVGQSILGLSVNCARCHDHKIDPIPQSDYYSMVAFFRGVRRYGIRSHESVLDASVMEIARPEDPSLRDADLAAYRRELSGIERELQKIESKVKADFSGVEVDEYQFEANHVRLIELRRGGLLTDDEVNRYRHLFERRQRLRDHPPSPMAKALCVKEDLNNLKPTYVLQRGNPQAPAEEVQPAFLSVLSPPEPDVQPAPQESHSSGRRSALAKWIVSSSNPLTARVMVNRIWQYHFGRGLVRTTSDFGFQGARPTHPELLDWLAATFMEDQWSLKAMHRRILNSAAWKMSSRSREDAFQRDAANEHFWRFDMRRLSAEEIRDSILWANKSLQTHRMFGPSVYTRIPAEVKAGQSQPGSGWGRSSPEDEFRRSIYIHVKRSLRDPLLESFDMADTDQTCPVRFVTTQPTQALSLLNSEFIREQSETFAKLAADLFPDSPEGQVRFGLHRVCQRDPLQEEVDRGLQLIERLQQDDGLTSDAARRAFFLVALNLNEFLYLD